MELKMLVERLEQLTGERVPENRIKNWAHTKEIISKPIGGGKGGRASGGNARKGDWPTDALEQAAAVWWVREKYRRICVDERKKLSKDQIDVINRAASALEDAPFAVYTLPPVVGPLSIQRMAPENIKMTFVREDVERLDLFPGEDKAERAKCLNVLIVAWAAAVEKVRAWEAEGMRAHIIVEHYPNLADLTPAELDYSQIDPWIVDVPCPWRIDKPALVALFWSSPPSKNNNESRKFWKPAFPFQRRLRESKRDEIVLYENFVDTREFFKIDIGDREGWERAEREKIEHELEEKKRELRHLGMEGGNFKTFLAMEKAPSETLTPREKLGLKTRQEMLGLEWRLAAIKNRGAARPLFSSN